MISIYSYVVTPNGLTGYIYRITDNGYLIFAYNERFDEFSVYYESFDKIKLAHPKAKAKFLAMKRKRITRNPL